MYNEAIRDLVYFIFPTKSLVKDATQWDYESDAERIDWPKSPEEVIGYVPFYSSGEINAVKVVDVALRELTRRSLNLKLVACRQRPEDYTRQHYGHVPLEIASNDYVFWARKSIWTPQEAALLSLGFCPSEKVVSAFNGLDGEGFSTCRLLREFDERAELIDSANQSGQLGGDGDSLELLQWFARMEYQIPDGLADTVFRIQSVKPLEPPSVKEAQYTDREKETLLKLVAAMAIRGYAFDANASRNPATKDIQADLDQLGISLDQKTILKWVREASRLVSKDSEN